MALSNPVSLAVAATSGGAAVTSSAFTPTANQLIIVLATYGSASAGAPVTFTISDTLGGLSWVEYTNHGVSGPNATTASIFVAVAPSSPIAGSVTITPSNTTNGLTGVWMQPYGVTGGKTSSPIGATLAIGASTGSLSSAPAASSLIISILETINGSNPTNTAPTGYTSVFNDSQSGPYNWTSLAYKNGSAGQTVTWSGGVSELIAIEILIAVPSTVPGAPTGVSAVPGPASATVTFVAPASDGGSTITGYTATSTPGSVTASISGAGASPITISGLIPGTSYTFTVHATNSIGNSTESASSTPVVPTVVPITQIKSTGFPSSYIEAILLGPSAQVTRRLEIYEADGITLWATIDNSVSRLIAGGSVTVDGTRDERRAIDVTLDSTDGLLNPNSNGFWYDKIIKVYRGITTPTEWYEVQIGEFMIDRIDRPNFPHTVHVTGRDYTKKLMLNKFTATTTYLAGSNFEDLIRDIIANAGITKYIIPATGITISVDFTFEFNTSRWDAVKKIADSYGYEVFFDGQGFFIMQPYRDPVTAGIAYTFETGQFGNLVSYSKSTNDSRLYNHIAVTGSSSLTIPIFAEAKNIEPSSPTRIAKIGDRLDSYQSEFIPDVATAQLIANQRLSISALESYELNFNSIVIPWLEANSIIEFIDPDPDVSDPTRFLMDTFSIPLDLSPMQATAKRVTIVSSTGTF